MHPIDLDSAAAFLACLTGANGWTASVFFQTFDDRAEKRPALVRVRVGSLRTHASELRRLNREGACVAVAVNNLRGTRRRASEVTGLRALFIDCDGPLTRSLALAPSISVQSKSGPHHYWLLHPGESVSLFAAAQRQLAAFYGSDPMVSDPSRVMRVPGFLHQKAEPFLVQLAATTVDRRYTLRDAIAPHDGATTDAVPHTQRNGGPASAEAVRAFRVWAAAAPRYSGTRNTTAFVLAAEGLKTDVPMAIVEDEVRAYCDRAGIPAEATAVLRSARRRSSR
jgi:hypothetical protein